MDDSSLKIRETGLGLVVRLHIQPRARRSELAGVHNGALKLKVMAPPVDDAANRAIIEFFSDLLGVSKASFSISAGAKSREKTLQIRGITLGRFLERIGLR